MDVEQKLQANSGTGRGIRLLLSVVALGLVLVSVLAIGVYYYLTGKNSGEPTTEPQIPAGNALNADRKTVLPLNTGPLDGDPGLYDMETEGPAPDSAQKPDPDLRLPELNFSDSSVRSEFGNLSSQSRLTEWLNSPHLIRKFVLMVDNVSRGTIPRKQLVSWAPKGKFNAADNGAGGYVAAPQSFHRYDSYADTLASMDAGTAVNAYRLFKPLFDEAYRELGYPGGNFNQPLLAAITHLLATPDVSAQAVLVRPSVMYKYSDPKIESLSAAQKQLLRMGPRNRTLIKKKLAEFRSVLSRS